MKIKNILDEFLIGLIAMTLVTILLGVVMFLIAHPIVFWIICGIITTWAIGHLLIGDLHD